MKYRIEIALTVVACVLRANGQCATDIHPSLQSMNVSVINFIPHNAQNAVIGNGIHEWAYGCSGYAAYFPELIEHNTSINSYDYMNVDVTFIPGRSTSPSGACGKTDVVINNGQIIGASVNLWEQQADGQDCTPYYAASFAHEIGHVLGLDDETSAACANTIMGTNIGPPSTDQCDEVRQNWVTGTESNPDDPYCSAYCWTQCINGQCPNPPGSNCTTCSPIILDLDDDGFDLVGKQDAVRFDINADGGADWTSWTRGGTRDAFLVLDRNDNGSIDDGSELFGTSTPLLSGEPAPNGYVALAEYDRPESGGNGDGEIDDGDYLWSNLRVWIDSDHDGRSDANEMLNLADAGVQSIDLKYIRSNHTDEYGNVFRFKGKAQVRDKHGRVHSSNTYDVYFVVVLASPKR